MYQRGGRWTLKEKYVSAVILSRLPLFSFRTVVDMSNRVSDRAEKNNIKIRTLSKKVYRLSCVTLENEAEINNKREIDRLTKGK